MAAVTGATSLLTQGTASHAKLTLTFCARLFNLLRLQLDDAHMLTYHAWGYGNQMALLK